MVRDNELYPFYKANIHERRFAARFFRALPLACFVIVFAVVTWSVFFNRYVLLVLNAVMNVAIWLWIVSTCIIAIIGSIFVNNELQAHDKKRCKLTADNTKLSDAVKAPSQVYGATESASEATESDSDSVVHLIVLPNYKEEEAMLSQTLASLSEAKDAKSFRVYLAMEEREASAVEKGEHLKQRWKHAFEQVEHTHHPANLIQRHNDGSIDPEVPGKASNVKWAVQQAYQKLQKDQVVMSNVILTVADADCIFHPEYFSSVTKDFNAMRENPGGEQKWTMWQAPQLSFRDHWRAIICSRSWTYVSGMYETGGVSGLFFGGHHMVFSGYSLTLELALNAESWDGDVIAEDHHAYLKNWYYSAYESAKIAMQDPPNVTANPMLQVKPIFLPVKSTPVIAEDGYWQNYVDRWNQAIRHTQGVAEFSYALLAAWDALCVMPFRAWSFRFFIGVGKIVTRLFCMHILPIIEAYGLAVLTLYWLWNKLNVPMCPDYLSFVDMNSQYVLCGLAGAWVLAWPMAVVIGVLILANFAFAYVTFIKPARVKGDDTVWRKEDGDFPELSVFCGSKTVAAFALITGDCCTGLFIMCGVYGFLAMLLSFWNCCFHGNVFNYISAAKPTKAPTKDDAKV